MWNLAFLRGKISRQPTNASKGKIFSTWLLVCRLILAGSRLNTKISIPSE